MGGKESKQSFISYEEAVKRVTDVELKRLRDAFSRSSLVGGVMSKASFSKEVVGDVVPEKLLDHLFETLCSSSKGLSFRDLLCTLVVLTRGSQSERSKLLFGVYANQQLTHVVRQEMDRQILSSDGALPPSLNELFCESDRVEFPEFSAWAAKNSSATSLIQWLLLQPPTLQLTNDHDMPNFYQTLSGVTHLEETDISELEEKYWVLKGQSKTGRLDLDTFHLIVSPPIPQQITAGVFNAFDENCDNHIDFKELACGISACCRGPNAERQKFVFKIFDTNKDGMLDRREVEQMMNVMLLVSQESCKSLKPGMTVNSLTERLLLPCSSPDQVSLEDYLVWAVDEMVAETFLELLLQVCHVMLGLRPKDRHEEGQVIIGWLEREHQCGLQLKQMWYLISLNWWRQWLEYTHMMNSSPKPGHSRNNSLSNKRNLGSLASDDISGSYTLYSNCDFPPKEAIALPSSPVPSPKLGKRIVGSKPGPIDNTPLISKSSSKVTTLTSEGGYLKKEKMQMRDFEILPEPVWKALALWYGSVTHALPRPVIATNNPKKAMELELYPLFVNLYRHQLNSRTAPSPASLAGIVGGMGGMAASAANFTNSTVATSSQQRRYLAYTSCFSRKHTLCQVYEFFSTRLRICREDLRLWLLGNEMSVLEDEDRCLEVIGIKDGANILIEVRNKDLTWPEEMSLIATSRGVLKGQKAIFQGATGLSNLGNTCFLNSALQCVSNTQVLTNYFNDGIHLFELNRANPLGSKGHVAQRYGELIKDLWSGASRSIAPLKLRWTIGKHEPRFNGFQQHDSQELLAFLLDGLHEDLNRVQEKPYVELKDSDGRLDEVVAAEAWDNHLRRNRSIIVDLFHGQLKSCVRCQKCQHTSVRFDPFTFLSLPLPMENFIHVEVIVVLIDGSTPTKYGLRLNNCETFFGLKRHLNILSGVPVEEMVLVELLGPQVKGFPQESQKVKLSPGTILYVYQLPPVSSAIKSNVVANGLPDGLPDDAAVADSLNAAAGGDNSSSKPFKSCIKQAEISDAMLPSTRSGFIVAVHRKMIRMDVYFVSWQKCRPSLFGTPLLLPVNQHTTNERLYQLVWMQVSRLVSPLPPMETSNHAQDCDDSLHYAYPFMLKIVQRDGFSCALCPWHRFCRGCCIECDKLQFVNEGFYVAIDWEPTALHLRYQAAQEALGQQHLSVTESRRLQVEPIDLDKCLRAFTKEEELGDAEMWYCSKCKTHRIAKKTLSIWKLPPILIIHLKRFQSVGNRWIKSQKIVKFPLRDFNPQSYLLPRKVSGTSDHDTNANRVLVEHKPSSSGDANFTSTEIPLYDLYAISCHNGILGGGHYIAYAKNPNNRWYCYNDSSCKEVSVEQMDLDSAYILFYERQDLDSRKFLPDTTGKQPDMSEIVDDFESDFKKMCSIQ